MQVILPDEQIHQIKRLLGNLIEQEIKNKLHNSHFDSPFLNKKQTCDYLGISNNTLDSWIKKGLPVIFIFFVERPVHRQMYRSFFMLLFHLPEHRHDR